MPKYSNELNLKVITYYIEKYYSLEILQEYVIICKREPSPFPRFRNKIQNNIYNRK